MLRILSAVVMISAVVCQSVFAQQTPPQRPANGTPPAPGSILGRPSPPQPTQKQGIEYFLGTWTFKWTGRESPLTAGPRTGSTTFTRLGDTSFFESRTEGTVDGGGAFKESGMWGWHDGQKVLVLQETLWSAAQVLSIGDWSSPIAIRFEAAPIRIAATKQTVRLKRNFSIISATSFSIAEELSTDGGPFVRLGSGVFTKKQPATR